MATGAHSGRGTSKTRGGEMRGKPKHPARLAWIIVLSLLAFVFAYGCGDDDDDDSGEGHRGEAQAELGEGEGEVNLIAWAGYVEDGSTDPEVDWVTDFEEGDRLRGQRQDRQHVRRDGPADADRRVRRRLGLRRCDRPACIEGEDVVAGQHGPDPELRGRLRRPEGPGLQQRRRPDVRGPARPRLEPPDVRPG